jgi:hypothetical protein
MTNTSQLICLDQLRDSIERLNSLDQSRESGSTPTDRRLACGGWEYQACNEGQMKGGDPITRDWESNTHYV